MMTVKEVKEWLTTLPDDLQIGVDEGGLRLEDEDANVCLEIGGIPEKFLESDI